MQHLEDSLAILAETLKLTLEGISLLCILLGLLKTAQLVLFQIRRSHLNSSPLMTIRINFGHWLSIALEFQLAADIVNTTIAPSAEALAKLAAITAIRTFLNYFLTKELAEALTVNNYNRYAPSINTSEKG
jgi:uncharacterized membrane protein